MTVTFSAKVDVSGVVKSLNKNSAFWTFAYTEWYRLISPYTPMQTGNLMSNVRITADGITYLSPYAHKMYNGTNLHFRRDMHPLAGAKWDVMAAHTQKQKLISSLSSYIKGVKL